MELQMAETTAFLGFFFFFCGLFFCCVCFNLDSNTAKLLLNAGK